MTKKALYAGGLAAFFLVLWIYRSCSTETSSIIYFLEQNIFFKNPIIEPANTTCQNNLLFVIIVTSYVGHVELRSAHRRAMPQEYLQSINSSRVFLLAKIPKNERHLPSALTLARRFKDPEEMIYITQASINDESKIYGDILQGSFTENYRNLTYKHLMGLQWASTVCGKAEFILKVDDDIVFNLNGTHKYLSSIPYAERENIMTGFILNNTHPKRNKQNKWYVTWDEYPRIDYPPYLSGWYYIISPKRAKELCQEAQYHPYFWIDDIFITGVLTEALQINLKQLPKIYWLNYYELLECCLNDMITKFVKCDYIVGPNGGRNNLIVEFSEALNNCDHGINCTVRSSDSPLERKCVMYRERSIFSEGRGVIKFIDDKTHTER